MACTVPSGPSRTIVGSPCTSKIERDCCSVSRTIGIERFTFENAAVRSLLLTFTSSVLTVRISTLSLLRYLSYTCCKLGSPLKHQPHQVAQKSSTTTLPDNVSRLTGLPSRSEN